MKLNIINGKKPLDHWETKSNEIIWNKKWKCVLQQDDENLDLVSRWRNEYLL